MLLLQALVDGERLALLPWFKRAARQLKRNVLALYYATQDPDVGWAPRVIAAFVLAYALSPMDLIPDFIPVLGVIDDLILLPGMIWLVSCPLCAGCTSSLPFACLCLCKACNATFVICQRFMSPRTLTYLAPLQHQSGSTSRVTHFIIDAGRLADPRECNAQSTTTG